VKLRVECYSGTKADERPVRFYLSERALFVEEVLDRWYGPNDLFFKVRADDAISTSFGTINPLPTAPGAWNRSGKSGQGAREFEHAFLRSTLEKAGPSIAM